jgi:hypothetical protein
LRYEGWRADLAETRSESGEARLPVIGIEREPSEDAAEGGALRLAAQIVWQQDPNTVEEEDHRLDSIVVTPHRARIIERYFVRLHLFWHGT